MTLTLTLTLIPYQTLIPALTLTPTLILTLILNLTLSLTLMGSQAQTSPEAYPNSALSNVINFANFCSDLLPKNCVAPLWRSSKVPRSIPSLNLLRLWLGFSAEQGVSDFSEWHPKGLC